MFHKKYTKGEFINDLCKKLNFDIIFIIYNDRACMGRRSHT